MSSRSEDMRHILDQIQQISINENRDFFMPDQRASYDELIDLLELANEAMLYDAADWLRSRLNEMSVHFDK